ncbi:MAG TPA: transposase [Thermoanaerobaculia bacterium]
MAQPSNPFSFIYKTASPPSQTQAVLGRASFGGRFTSYSGMGRKLRYIPEGGALVEVTCRTFHSHFLLRPGGDLDGIIVGVLGRAQRLYEVRCCGYMWASNHFHLLLDVDNARQLAKFMCYVNSKIAREISRLHGWTEKIWSRRYQAIVISDEDGAQIARLKYLLANGCKEGLVARPQDWPGVHVAKALIQDEDLTGYWFDRTREYAAHNRGEAFGPLQYATLETLYLSPLPCWKHLPKDVWRARALGLIQEIEEEAAAERARTGDQPLGPAAILAQHPLDRPKNSKKSPAPLFHAASARVRRELWEGYRLFVAAFRQAAERLRAGDRDAVFPLGSFPPALPFVGG